VYGSLTRNKYFSDGWDIAFNVSVSSLGPRLSPWHCPQLLLLSAVLRPRAAVGRPASPLSVIIISCPHGAQQQTRRRMMGQTDEQRDSRPLRRSCFSYCARTANSSVCEFARRRVCFYTFCSKPCFVFAVARINQFKLAVISQSGSDNIAKRGETYDDL